jgi:hypothetical protein
MSETPPPGYINYPRDPIKQREIRLDYIGEAVKLFQENPKPYLMVALPGLLLAVPNLILQLPGTSIVPESAEAFGPAVIASIALSLVLGLITWVYSFVATAGLIRMGISQMRGIPVTDWKEAFNTRGMFWQLLLAGILTNIAQYFGLLLCLVGAFFIGGLLMLTPAFISDKKLDAVTAMSASWSAIKPSWPIAGLLFLVISLILSLSPCCLAVGYLVGLPVYALTVAVTYYNLVD